MIEKMILIFLNHIPTWTKFFFDSDYQESEEINIQNY